MSIAVGAAPSALECRVRWGELAIKDKVRPIEKPWSLDEDLLLIALLQQYNYQWYTIQKEMQRETDKWAVDKLPPVRSANDCKKRFIQPDAPFLDRLPESDRSTYLGLLKRMQELQDATLGAGPRAVPTPVRARPKSASSRGALGMEIGNALDRAMTIGQSSAQSQASVGSVVACKSTPPKTSPS
jgi:hypothetical protein